MKENREYYSSSYKGVGNFYNLSYMPKNINYTNNFKN